MHARDRQTWVLVLNHAAGAGLQQAQHSVDSLLSLRFASLSQGVRLDKSSVGGLQQDLLATHAIGTIRQKNQICTWATLAVKHQVQHRVANVCWFVERLVSEERTEFYF